MYLQIHNRKYLKETRQVLRNNATPAEKILWEYLKQSQLSGRKFRRQHSIGNYIADFYCPTERLIIEIDGEVHNETRQKQKDLERDKILSELNFKILRFTNKQIFEKTNLVLKKIETNFKKQ